MSDISSATPPPWFFLHLKLELNPLIFNVSLAHVSQHLISFKDIISGLVFRAKIENSLILFFIELQFQWTTFILSFALFLKDSRIVELSAAVSILCHVFQIFKKELLDLLASISL